MSHRPHYIVFEGADFCGKSTQLRHAEEWCRSNGIDCVSVREPGGTEIAEQLRTILLHGKDVHPMTELMLFQAARASLVEEVIRPALAAGKWVLSDRGALSGAVYQSHARGTIDLRDMFDITRIIYGKADPSAILVFQIDEATADERAAKRDALDRMEKSGRAFFAKVREAYDAPALFVPPAWRLCVHPFDGRKPADDLKLEVAKILNRLQ